ncbi:MAG: glycoside hydrolase family 5 protein [Gammaproteobacteria bacterium]|nr:glycoside hydrolase family 5 protein [Gammaproteobacteria bacterium]MCD8542629.1 glycoside hydrolase family 5 protein [Gammaproteobacteria bacterium]
MSNDMRFLEYLTTIFAVTQTVIVNGETVTNEITGVGSADDLINPYFCIQKSDGKVTCPLAYGESADGNECSGNDYYVGGALRFDGCDYDNTYLGYLGLSISSTQKAISSYTQPEGVHIAYTHASIDSAGTLSGSIEYTPIEPNIHLVVPANTNLTWSYAGINLSGFEFDKVINPVTAPNLSEIDQTTAYTDLADTNNFIATGANTIRMPLHWGYLQPDGPGQGQIYQNYYNSYLKPFLQSTTQSKIYTILDIHAYMRYSEFGEQYAGCGATGPCPDGTLITDPAPYIDVWTKLYDLLKNDPDIDEQYILLDLMNEPVDVPDDKVFTIQVAVIQALRNVGYEGPILVEGNAWSGLHSWTTESWQGSDGQLYTNANLFTRENFAKAGITDLTKIFINAHQYFDNNYSGSSTSCQTDLSTTGANGFNLQAFIDYLEVNQLFAMVTEYGTGTDSYTCSIALTQFLDYLKANAVTSDKTYGFVGHTIWSTGHGWGSYNLRVKPDSYQWKLVSSYLHTQGVFANTNHTTAVAKNIHPQKR